MPCTVHETRKSVREFENYKEIKTFNSAHFEQQLIAASRIKYDDPAGLKAKLIYTDTGRLGPGYEVSTEFVADPSNKGLQLN